MFHIVKSPKICKELICREIDRYLPVWRLNSRVNVVAKGIV